MAVSKRTRFEVMRRDDFTCRYCRSTEGELTIDHVIPMALGGSDDPSNLVAACRDCNAGKSSTSAAAATVAQVEEDAARWSAAIRLAAERAAADDAARAAALRPFIEEWTGWDKDASLLPDNWRAILMGYLSSGLTPQVLVECAQIAAANRNVRSHDVFPYMCGIARKKVERLHVAARAILDEGGC